MSKIAALVSFTGAVWMPVTPQTLTVEVAEFIYKDLPGSVQDEQYRRSKPVEFCPIIEDGKTVGFRLNCEAE